MNSLKRKLHQVIFGVDTAAGRIFDVVLLVMILASIAILMLESVESVSSRWGHLLKISEWVITLLFTLEYMLRIWITDQKLRYVRSFYGLIDLFSILPTYLSFFFSGSHALAVIRVLRLLRVFRVLKLVRFMGEASLLRAALRSSSRKIIIFVFFVIIVSVFIGTLMYLIEGREHGFSSIPRSIYWAIVTLTTVGYGDIAPQTTPGQFLAMILMVTGYGVIAVPTGLVTAEIVRERMSVPAQKICPACFEATPETGRFCMHCGTAL